MLGDKVSLESFWFLWNSQQTLTEINEINLINVNENNRKHDSQEMPDY